MRQPINVLSTKRSKLLLHFQILANRSIPQARLGPKDTPKLGWIWLIGTHNHDNCIHKAQTPRCFGKQVCLKCLVQLYTADQSASMKINAIAGVLAWAAATVSAASTFSPARPPAIPLAVKSPYLNTYLQSGSDDGDGGYLAGRWAQHWSKSTTAMAGYIRVDGIVYEFMGNPNQRTPGPQVADQTSFSYSATRSIFTQTVGPVKLTTTFLSPIYPQDQMRASLVASYVQTEATSLDGAAHDVQLYMDVSGGEFRDTSVLRTMLTTTRMGFGRRRRAHQVGLRHQRHSRLPLLRETDST